MGEQFDPRCHVGEIHGIYEIVDMLNQKDQYGHWIYKCVCTECGFIKYSHYGEVSGPKSKTTQCKHLRLDGSYITQTVWKNQRLRKIFSHMMERCYNVNHPDYRWYGAKNVGICPKWRDNPHLFEEWALSNGYKDDLTIDRIESDKDYCPENCRWIERAENTRRAGIVNWIELDGKRMTGKQWAAYLQIGANTINTAIRNYGLDKTKELILAMLNEPPTTKHRKSRQTWFSVYGISV